ncbi:MAG: hypothetical protein V1684_00135 [bacterium]
MIEKIISSGFRVEKPIIPKQHAVIPEGTPFANLNPQCGAFPFGKILMSYSPADKVAIFKAEISDAFNQAQIIPRGRPHLSLLHLALFDDAIASSAFTLITNEAYGLKYRYIEPGVVACFHQEAFLSGSLRSIPRGTIFVDKFSVYWQCLPIKNHDLLQRGIFQVLVVGIKSGEEIPIASVEGMYFRRKGVIKG